MADTYSTDYKGDTGTNIGAWQTPGSSPPPPPPPSAQKTFYFNPSDLTVGANPLTALFSVRDITVDAVDYSSIIEDTTPVGDKVWRLGDAQKGNRIFNLNAVDSDYNDIRVLILHRASGVHGSGHCIPFARLNASGAVNGYAGGLVSDLNVRCRRWADSASTSLGTAGVAHGITSLVNTPVYTEFDISANTLRVRSWEYGTAQPAWQQTVSDTTYASGRSGFQVWLNGVDHVAPVVDILWMGVATEGAQLLFPEEVVNVPPVHVYYSFSPYGATSLLVSDPNISISSGVATFSFPQTANTGQGCRITYDTDQVVYISKKLSLTEFEVTTATGERPMNIVFSGVVSITHEYASLAAAIAGASDVNHLNTLDLESSDIYLHLVGYYDHDDGTKDTSPATVTGYTVGSANRIIIETPTGGEASISNNRQLGYIPAVNPEHYQLHPVTTENALNIANEGVIVNGLEIFLNNGTVSMGRGVAVTDVSSTIRNCLVWANNVTENQSCIRAVVNSAQSRTVTLESNILVGGTRAGANFAVTNAGGTLIANLNSNTIYGCGSDGGGGVRAYNIVSGTLTVNALNNIVVDNATDFSQEGTATWDIHNSIASDNSISARDGSAHGCLANRSTTHNSSPGEGDWVIFRSLSAVPYDLRLVNVAENDAIDMHTDSTGAGMTIPSTDVSGANRPYNTSFDCGAYEWAVAEVSATDILTASPEFSTPWLQQVHVLTAADITTGEPIIGSFSDVPTHRLTASSILTGAPTLSIPQLNANMLTSGSILTGNPEISIPTLGQIHNLTAPNILTGAPQITAPKWVVTSTIASRTFTIAFENRTSIVLAGA
jgi:hypothetical protein